MKDEIKKIIRVGFSLAKVNFRLRIENSYLGIFWYLLNPLLMFGILLLVKEAAFPETDIPYYPLFLIIGISAFNFFKQAISESIGSINYNPDYLKSINQVKAESLVISVVIQSAFSHAFELILIIATAIILKSSLVAFVTYPLIFLLFFIITLGISFIFATIGVYISDLNNIWGILSQILFLISPIFYLPNENGLIAKFNLINPIAYFLDVLRGALIYGELKLTSLLIMLALGILSLGLGVFIFQKHKHKFAELL